MKKKSIPFTQEHKKKISKNHARFWAGKKRSQETIEKIRRKLIKSSIKNMEGRITQKNNYKNF